MPARWEYGAATENRTPIIGVETQGSSQTTTAAKLVPRRGSAPRSPVFQTGASTRLASSAIIPRRATAFRAKKICAFVPFSALSLVICRYRKYRAALRAGQTYERIRASLYLVVASVIRYRFQLYVVWRVVCFVLIRVMSLFARNQQAS